MVKYLHVRTIDESGAIFSCGGITVAYTTTPKDICLSVAMCHDNDHFNYRVGREIAGGRLKSPKHQPTVIELHHPITQAIVDWLALEWFEVPVYIYLDNKYRWVSTFETYETEVSDTDWLKQMSLETGLPSKLEGDQGVEGYSG